MSPLGKHGNLGGGTHLPEVNYLGYAFRGHILSLTSLCLMSSWSLKSSSTCTTTVMFCLTLCSKQWRLLTMAFNLWSYEPKYTSLAFYGLSQVFVSAMTTQEICLLGLCYEGIWLNRWTKKINYNLSHFILPIIMLIPVDSALKQVSPCLLLFSLSYLRSLSGN